MNDKSHRPILSFVRREGRLTPGQQQALDELLPRYGIPFAPEQLDLDALFDRAAPRTLEIGCGNGETLITLAAAQPDRDFIGVEVYRPGVGRLLRRMAEEKLTNVRVSMHDAVQVLREQIPDAALDAVLLYFPDPWPKKRHHKRRIVQANFCALVARKLKSGGHFHLATDWAPYAEHMLDVLTACPYFANTSSDRNYVPRPPERPHTKFEQRGERLGHTVADLVFIRNKLPLATTE